MEINGWQILFQALNFGVILFVLNKFLYKPILDVLDKREQKINEGLRSAEKSSQAAQNADKERKEIIAKARKEALAIQKEAEREAKSKADAILVQARQTAKTEAERIRESAEAEKAQTLKKLDQEAAKLAVAMAKKALASALSAKEVEAITQKLVSKLG